MPSFVYFYFQVDTLLLVVKQSALFKQNIKTNDNNVKQNNALITTDWDKNNQNMENLNGKIESNGIYTEMLDLYSKNQTFTDTYTKQKTTECFPLIRWTNTSNFKEFFFCITFSFTSPI